jgi:hypothetical protein
MRNLTLRSASLALAALLLNSCGSNPSGLTLSMSDAPVDTALAVNVAIAEVDLVDTNGNNVSGVTFEPPSTIDLFTFQGGLSGPLVEQLGVPAGNYKALIVTLATDPLSPQSSVAQPDGSHILYIPNGSPSQITVPVNFSIASDTVTNVTIDFDVRRSVIQDPIDPTKYILIPSMRAVVNELSGSITGSVDPTLISSVPNCIQGMTVYAYNGSVQPTDVNINLPAGSVQPVSTALVGLNATSGQYNFTLGFLPTTLTTTTDASGNVVPLVPTNGYTLAFTCQGNEDTPNQSDAVSVKPNLLPNTIQFSSVAFTTVQANNTVFVALH